MNAAHAILDAFLMSFPALFSIVNPLSGAFTFREIASGERSRAKLARRVAIYSALVILGSLWAGPYVLAFFGITLSALRIAGGVVLALTAWEILHAPEKRDARKQDQVSGITPSGVAPSAASAPDDPIAFYPLTLPFTTGPGTISVSIALGSQRPRELDALWPFFVGVSGAALAMAVVIWIAYAGSDSVARLIGPSGSRTVTRMGAFLLMCIGAQILLTGVTDVLRGIVRP